MIKNDVDTKGLSEKLYMHLKKCDDAYRFIKQIKIEISSSWCEEEEETRLIITVILNFSPMTPDLISLYVMDATPIIEQAFYTFFKGGEYYYYRTYYSF